MIAIAHRLSTIARMDRLIIIEQGRIVEQGSHEELLQLDGHYARLWRHQSGGFLAPEALPGAEEDETVLQDPAPEDHPAEPAPESGTDDVTVVKRA